MTVVVVPCATPRRAVPVVVVPGVCRGGEQASGPTAHIQATPRTPRPQQLGKQRCSRQHQQSNEHRLDLQDG